MDKMVALMVELRKGKMTEEECRKLLKQANYFGTMLVKMGYADALLGGATYSTADTVRPALQIITTKPGSKIVSSCFILVRPSATGDREVLAMGDCAINIKPTEDELVEIAIETAETAKTFGIDPKVAFLSYSTLGSGKGEDVDKMRNACAKAKAARPDLAMDGELQFDAAVSPKVAQTKCPDSAVAGHANTFIFPDINAGNIGYKIAQRLGSFAGLRPHPAGSERSHQRPVPWLQRPGGLLHGHHHRRPVRGLIETLHHQKTGGCEVLHLIGKRTEPPGALPVRSK